MAVKTEAPTRTTTDIRPFRIDIPEADLEALRARIAATRWPEKQTVDDQSQGVPLETSQALARTLFWLTNTGVSPAASTRRTSSPSSPPRASPSRLP